MTQRTPLRVAFVGWGAIARTAAELLAERSADPKPDIEIVAVAVRDVDRDRPPAPGGARLVATPPELLATEPDLVVEAAGRESVEPWGRAALNAGVDLMLLSISAFAGTDLLDEFITLAEANDARIHLPPGAIGGIDALVAARYMSLTGVEHRIVKPPAGWRGSTAEELCDLDNLTEPTTFFTGSSPEAASQFPKNANVTMTTALAGVGPEHTRISLVADPTATANRHEIRASGDFGELEITLANAPLPANPKSSAMTALSLARAIANLRNTLII